MANNISVTIGAQTYTVPIKLTNAQLRAALLRYAVQRGIRTEGRTEQQIAEAVLRSLLKYVGDNSTDRQRAELLEAQRATIEATIKSDNELFDEPIEVAQARL